MNTFKTSLVTACVFGMFVATASAQVRLFMAADGEESTVATTGNTQVTMFPGTSKKIMVWLEDTVQSEGLNSYHVIAPSDATPQPSAAGAVSYVDAPGTGDSVFLDIDRADYVFHPSTYPPTYLELPAPPEPESVFGCIGFMIADGGGPPVFGTNYLYEFTLYASGDAAGHFELAFVPFGGPSVSTAFWNESVFYAIDEMQRLTISVLPRACPGNLAQECCDLDSNGARDDPCVWCECAAAPMCAFQDAPFADAGGEFGACLPDGFCNVHDRNHALTCFSGTNPCDTFNIDAGGAFGACVPDGFCNVHDANHALSCFAGTSTCSCPAGPSPEIPPTTAGAARIRAAPNRRRVAPDGEVRVRVFIEPAIDHIPKTPAPLELQSYQLHVEVTGGRRGRLELVGVMIEPRPDYVFAGRDDVFAAFNTDTGQMLAGLDSLEGAAVSVGYLSTFVYRASPNAAGTFVIDVLHDGDPGNQTFLVAPFNDRIDIAATVPGVLVIRSASSGGLR